MTRVKQSNLPAHLKRIVDDTDRRLNILFDGLNDESVPDHAVDQMLEISKGQSMSSPGLPPVSSLRSSVLIVMLQLWRNVMPMLPLPCTWIS